MRRDFHELKVGDVISANLPIIGEHICIIHSVNEENNFECYPTVNLSSNCEVCQDCCIKLYGIDIPEDWFKIKKDVSYIRLEEGYCVNEDEYEPNYYSFKGNLISKYKTLWQKICALNPATSVLDGTVCECEMC